MSWVGDQYMMPNMMGMQPMVWQNMLPNAMQPNQVQVPGEFNMNGHQNPNQNAASFPGAVQMQPQGQESVANEEGDDGNQDKGDRRDRERYRDRGRRELRKSRELERNDRPDRNDRNDRSRSDRRERRTKWSYDNTTPNNGPALGNNNMIMHGNMMQFGNAMNQPMEMANMQNMANMMPSMSMPGMMEQNMMIMNQQMPLMANQPVYLTSGVLLPPTPGLMPPPRMLRPDGCRTIFIGGLPATINESLVNEMFQRFGEIDSIKMQRQGVCHVRFARPESIEQSFCLSSYRFKYHDQMEADAVPIYIDYALNRDDQEEYERMKRRREPTPPRIEPFLSTTLSSLIEKIKNDAEFADAAPTLVGWLERGECNKKNANTFYSLIQATNNHIRRLVNEKMQIDEEFHAMKGNFKDKFMHVIMQFDQVAKILSAAKHQRVSDHFTKQQRRNVDMWLKMTEEVANMKEEYSTTFDDDDIEKTGKNTVPLEKYEQLKKANENLVYELEGYKNEAHLAKDEAERKFEKFKAHFIAEQALKNEQKQGFSSTIPLPMSTHITQSHIKTEDTKASTPKPDVPHSEAKLISLITAFLMIHPLGATLDYLVSYLKSMMPDVSQSTVSDILGKYHEVFHCKTTGVGANIEHKWYFITFDSMKK